MPEFDDTQLLPPVQDRGPRRPRRAGGLLTLAIVLLVAGGVLGLVFGVLAGAVSNAFDVGSAAPQTPPPARASAGPATPTASPSPAASGPTGATTSASPTASPSASTTPTPSPSGPISLSVDPATVSPGQRARLSGSAPGQAGGSLQVQRLTDGQWRDFPVTASVGDDGSFSVSIATSRRGDSQFRVVDPTSGIASDPVTLTVS
ncbi:MAG: hypothetical protein ACTHMZ_05420 [Actinomycetes bacterium]